MQWILLAAALVGVALLIGAVHARLLLPLGRPGAFVCLPAAEEGDSLEQDCRTYLMLRRHGMIQTPLYLIDCGLSPEGVRLARQLTRLDAQIFLCTPEQLLQLTECDPSGSAK